MDKRQRENLLRTVEKQEEIIEDYKQKLRNVVEAYKEKCKENQALEASLNALTSVEKQPNQESLNETDPNQENQSDTKDTKTNDSVEPSEEAIKSEVATSDEQQKIDTLTASLKTLMQQKTALQSNLLKKQKDYKVKLEEKDKRINELQNQTQQQQNEIAEWRGKLRNQQQEHTSQQEDCTLMIKELQTLLNQEKLRNQQIANQMCEIKNTMDEKSRMASAQINSLFDREKFLEKELKLSNEELKQLQQNMLTKAPKLQILQQQVQQFKEKEIQMEKEHSRKTLEWEKMNTEMTKQHEDRVNEMESRILQMSQMLAEVETNKKHQLDTIQKLNEKNAQLDFQLSNFSSILKSSECKLENLSRDELYEKAKEIITRLKRQNFETALLSELVGEEHEECKKQKQLVEEEFERYKLRAQSILKNKNKEKTIEQETLLLKSQISELKDQETNLKLKIFEKEKELKSKEENFSVMLSKLQTQHSLELEKAAAEARQKVLNVEGEMRRQRDRTVNMLSEKDQELSEMRCKLASLEDTKRSLASYNDVGASSMITDESSLTVEQLLLSRSKDQSKGTDRILHYAQEKAMMEMEINACRKEKYRLESELKELRLEYTNKENLLEQEVAVLKEEVRKCDRASKRESANLEYIKNIVYQYMLASSSNSKQQIAKAISTILQFSPSEKNTLYNKKGWVLNRQNNSTRI